MKVKSNIYDKFTCIGSDCVCNCCHGWRIDIDDETAKYYQNIEGKFGDQLRAHLTHDESGFAFRLGCDEPCTGLDDDGLCLVYKNCEPEHMSRTCKEFPRSTLMLDGHLCWFMLSSDCEEVNRILWQMKEDLRLQFEVDSANAKVEPEEEWEIILYVFAQFVAWAVETIQDPQISPGVLLATILYVSLDVMEDFEKRDWDSLFEKLDRTPQIVPEFMALRESCRGTELEKKAWENISTIAGAFFAYVTNSNISNQDYITQIQPVFLASKERIPVLVKGLYDMWCTQMPEQREIFLRRMFANSFTLFYRKILLEKQKENEGRDKLFSQWFGITSICFTVLPALWEDAVQMDLDSYFTRLSVFSRILMKNSNVSRDISNAVFGQMEKEDLVMEYITAMICMFP